MVGPAGEEIHTDEFGRVRVQFHWDREGQMDENSSCWIHVSQPWGGTGYGGINLPRIGQEVLVDFLGGDPDRPVIIGRVYTNLQKTPYKLPDNKTQSGWKSNSTGSTGGYNEMMFEDAPGKELLRMQAEKDMHKLVKNDSESNVVRDNKEEVGANETVKVGGNREVTVMQNLTHTVREGDVLHTVEKGNTRCTTKQTLASHADRHELSSDTMLVLQVGDSNIIMRKDGIVIDGPKVLINPGADVVDDAKNGRPLPPTNAEQEKKTGTHEAVIRRG